MKFPSNFKSLSLTKLIALILFIPITIVVLFIAVPLLMIIVSIVLIIMYLTRNKFSKAHMSFNPKENPFFKTINDLRNNKNNRNTKEEKSDYVDAEYITIDDDKKK